MSSFSYIKCLFTLSSNVRFAPERVFKDPNTFSQSRARPICLYIFSSICTLTSAMVFDARRWRRVFIHPSKHPPQPSGPCACDERNAHACCVQFVNLWTEMFVAAAAACCRQCRLCQTDGNQLSCRVAVVGEYTLIKPSVYRCGFCDASVVMITQW